MDGGNPDAKRLYDDLLSNYNKLVRPVANVSDALTVKIKLKLSQLIDVVMPFYHLPILSSFSVLKNVQTQLKNESGVFRKELSAKHISADWSNNNEEITTVKDLHSKAIRKNPWEMAEV